MTNIRFLSFVPAGLLSACATGYSPVPYYADDGGAPRVDAVEAEAGGASEAGNTGGARAIIRGANFGGAPEAVTVLFGSQNAQVLRAENDLLEVIVPRGPLEGGAVPVFVGTREGQSKLDAAWEYQTAATATNQRAYITVTNDYFSCYAGVGNTLADFCQEFSYTGQAGLDGRAEFLQWSFPRLQTAFTGARGGFGLGYDESWGTWSVQAPAQDLNTFDLEGLYEDRRIDLGAPSPNSPSFTLKNPALEGQTFCVDETKFASYHWGGAVSGDAVSLPLTLNGAGNLTEEGDCSTSAGKSYDASVVQFCQAKDYENDYNFRYDADWPVGRYFFTNDDEEDRPDRIESVDLVLDVPGVLDGDDGEGITVTLPSYALFDATAGSGASPTEDWALYNFATCNDSNEDGKITLDDPAFRWEWTPVGDLASAGGMVVSGDAASKPGDVKSVRSFVKANVVLFTLGWLGGEGAPMRATITVPDDHNFNPDTGRSSLDLPAGTLFQFPSNVYDIGEADNPFGGGSTFRWGDPTRSDYSYIVLTLERVTEYVILADFEGSTGELVFSYSTGDISLNLFDNPLDQDSCGDCQDDDGDGWTDDKDPDCGAADGAEAGFDSSFTCNDGEDNDGDGLVDAGDPDCTSGEDGETNCGDGEDNDGDGLIDEEDGECDAETGTGFEVGDDDPSWGCNDSADNDADGWVDFDDPDCISAADDEVGLSELVCNDGVDNDGHGDIDAEDPTCARNGAGYPREQPTFSGECSDGTDNDGDGYTDGNDPDCEAPPYIDEDRGVRESADAPACLNGVDDDGDTLVDAADPGCARDGVPDGFIADEDASLPGVTGCNDGIDNDGDGWQDLADPDCVTVLDVEAGFGTAACNDNADNDADLAVDAADPECATATDEDEAG